MKSHMRKITVVFFILPIIGGLLGLSLFPSAYATSAAPVKLRILQTTDMHGHMMDENDEGESVSDFGLVRTATLIKSERNENKNVLLFDTGDILEGNAFADYIFQTRLMHLGQTHPVIHVMNTLRYDAMTLGNHEFNYGIGFLTESLRDVTFPIVSSNIYNEDMTKNIFDDVSYMNPYVILDRTLVDANGDERAIKIGVIGFLTPIVADWNSNYFKQKLKMRTITETANQYIPQMKAKGADIIIALAHVGVNADKGLAEQEGNSVNELKSIENIDVILFGHSHNIFPEKPNEWLQSQTTPLIVQAGHWGNHLGRIELELTYDGEQWIIEEGATSVIPIYKQVKGKKVPNVAKDKQVEALMKGPYNELKSFRKWHAH
ncbi:metallophosphoesterase [Cytobacillus kochii]|uniref:metallophosphoesterase n=1 Tax=Cytobacillus kochii TaxID=859143 RepID=UPI00402A93DC